MSDSKIVLDADHGKVDTAAAKTEQAYKKIGKAAGGIGNELEKAGKKFTGDLLKIAAIAKIIDAIGQQVKERQESTAGANRSAGRASLERSSALASLGLGGNTEAAYRGASGGTTLAERDTFVGALASANQGERVPFEKQDMHRALALFAGGGLSSEEILDKLKKRGDMSELVATQRDRLAALSPAARKEIRNMNYERLGALEKEDALVGPGQANRVALDRQEVRDAVHPIISGGSKALRSVPILGDMLSSFDVELIKLTRSVVKELQEINGKSTPEPTLNTKPAGE